MALMMEAGTGSVYFVPAEKKTQAGPTGTDPGMNTGIRTDVPGSVSRNTQHKKPGILLKQGIPGLDISGYFIRISRLFLQ